MAHAVGVEPLSGQCRCRRSRKCTVLLEEPPAAIVTISRWLGHVSVTTTNRYATVDLEMKRKAIEQARPLDHATTAVALWRTDASILKWLETL